MYESAKEVVRERLWQPARGPGLPRVPRLVFQTLKFKRDIRLEMPSVSVITFSEREEGSAEFKNMYSLRSLPPLTRTSVVSLQLGSWAITCGMISSYCVGVFLALLYVSWWQSGWLAHGIPINIAQNPGNALSHSPHLFKNVFVFTSWFVNISRLTIHKKREGKIFTWGLELRHGFTPTRWADRGRFFTCPSESSRCCTIVLSWGSLHFDLLDAGLWHVRDVRRYRFLSEYVWMSFEIGFREETCPLLFLQV